MMHNRILRGALGFAAAAMVYASGPGSYSADVSVPKKSTGLENKLVQDDNSFVAARGELSIPIKVGDGHWTYIIPQPSINEEKQKFELPNFDGFIREFKKDKVGVINVVWEERKKTLEEEFSNYQVQMADGGFSYVKNSKTEIVIAGEPAITSKYLRSAGSIKGYLNLAIFQHEKHTYVISVAYTDGFSDPEKTFERICKETKFLPKK